MKKKMIPYSCMILLLSACSKSNNSNSNGNDTWTFRNTNYKAATVVYINPGPQSNLSASATGSTQTSANGLVFAFSTPPTSSGQMLITNTGDSNTVMISTINLTGSTTTTYINDITNVKANITINGGKLSATFPGKIWLHNAFNFNDSAQLSVGTITQQ